MVLKINNGLGKKGFAFTFLALFIAILAFGFGQLYLDKVDFGSDSSFKNLRVQNIDTEFKYLKGNYLQDSLKFSFYNSLDNLLKNRTQVASLNSNYSNLNQFLLEAIINGTYQGVPQPNLKNKTMNYFLNQYSQSFNKLYQGNISFNIQSFYVYEKEPYYLSAQLEINYNLTTKDNIAFWNQIEFITVKVPIFNLYDPNLFIAQNVSYPIRSVYQYLPNLNWTVNSFNITIANVYSTMYVQKDYKYSLGSSFIEGLLNVSRSSYQDVVGFWSFDYDEETNKIYDTSQYTDFATHKGNSRLIFSFDNNSVFPTNISDLSDYENFGIKTPSLNCTSQGTFKESCYFNGINSKVTILNNPSINFEKNPFSFSIWMDIKNVPLNTNQTIFGKKNSFKLTISNVSNSLIINFEIWDGVKFKGAGSKFINPNSSYSNIQGVYDSNNLSLYKEGSLLFTTNVGNFNLTSNFNLELGSFNGLEFFNGSLDEFGLYSKALTSNEISDLYTKRKAVQVDYKKGLFGLALEFDGVDDFINLDNKTGANPIFNDEIIVRSGEFWFKTYNSSKTQIIYEEGGGLNGINVFINNSRVFVGAYSISNLWNGVWISSPILENRWNLVTYVFDNLTSGTLKLYLNGQLVNSSVSPINNISVHFDTPNIGICNLSCRLNGIFYTNSNFYFEGLIDEIKIYNRSLQPKEILENFYNFESFGKGCCNYWSLINPNIMGFNKTIFNKNVSSSSKIFLDFYKRGISHNMTLYNITNITSMITTKNYYNFLADDCMMAAFSIGNFNFTNPVGIPPKNIGIYNSSCKNFIKAGIY